MPVLTGIQALGKIRTIEALKDLPVIVFSTRSIDLQKRIAELGGTGLSKEAPQDFLPIVKRALESVK